MHDQLLQAITKRHEPIESFGYGLTTADRYVKQVVKCIGSACPTIGQCPDQLIKDAAGKLAWCSPDTELEGRWNGKAKQGDIKLPKGIELPDNTLMTLQYILTTPREDRDGDILRTDGAVVDPKMPLLWQHMPPLILGKMIHVVKQNAKQLKLVSVLLDLGETTELGKLSQDAAKLIEADALRFSHGFRVLEYEERRTAGDSLYAGFDIKRFEIMESSLVSVPSNVDAEMELWSRGNLESDIVKRHAKSLFDSRKKQFPGIDLEQKHVVGVQTNEDTVTITFSVDSQEDGMSDGEEDKGVEASVSGDAPTDTHKAEGYNAGDGPVTNKAVDLSVTSGMVDEARKGLEWREEHGRGGTQVGVTRANQIINDGKLTEETWRRVKAYFDRHQSDKEAEGWNPGEDGYPSAGRIAWALWGGDAGWTRAQKIVEQLNDETDKEVGGLVEMSPHEAKAQGIKGSHKRTDNSYFGHISERTAPVKYKYLMRLEKVVRCCDKDDCEDAIEQAIAKEFDAIKAGRALSRANQRLLEDAAANMDEVCKMEDTPRPCKALCREAAGYVKQVLDSAMSDEESPKTACGCSAKTLSPRDAMKQLVCDGDIETLKAIKRTVDTLLEAEANEDKARTYRKWIGA